MLSLNHILLTLGAVAIVLVIVFSVMKEEQEVPMITDRAEKTIEGTNELLSRETAYRDDEEAVFECLVVLRDQTDPDGEKDMRESLKRGDVISVRKSPQAWSATERASYLIVKVNLTGKEANALLNPKKEGDQVMLARERRINLDTIGFMGHQATGQPLENKTFEKNIIEMK